jgi:hypothetical protein
MAFSTICGQEELTWNELNYGGRTFLFNRDLRIRVTEKDGGWYFEADSPELVGFGDTRSDAEQAFRQDFAACWDYLAREREKDENMDLRTKKLKRALLELAKEM